MNAPGGPPPSDAATRRAPAKVNLVLAVSPARPGDGLHPICSWMAPLDLGDDLTVRRLPESEDSSHQIRWSSDALRPSPIDWPIEKDLAVRAHRALEAEAGRALPLAMTLEKRTPVGAGLGGGSSDAAAALLAIRELFALPVGDDRLAAIGLTLGADVPVFLPPGAGGAAIVEGVGEIIERTAPVRSASGGPVRLILIAPDFGCATGAVYRAFDADPPARFRGEEARSMARRGVVEGAALFNDLAAAAERTAPRLGGLRERIAALTRLPVHVTGSGSGLFVVTDAATPADALAREIEASEPGVGAQVVGVL